MAATSRTRFLGQTQQTVEGFRSNLDNPTTITELATLGMPVLVVCGAGTTKPDEMVAQIVCDTIPGSDYAVVADAGHMSPLTHPDQIAALVRKHLARSERAG